MSFKEWFRVWVRREERRFAAYRRLREVLHALRNLPTRAALAERRHVRRAWNRLYLLGYKLGLVQSRNPGYTLAADAGAVPPAPVPRWVTRTLDAIQRRHLCRVGPHALTRHMQARALAAAWHPLLEPRPLAIQAPRVFGAPVLGWPTPWPDLQVRLPGVAAARWDGATVIGKFDAVLLDGRSIVGDLWQRETERTFDEVRGYATLDGEVMTYYRHQVPPLSMERAIVVVGGPTGNWAHWTTEYLPKIALVDRIEAYRGWPLVVDRGLHPNILASIELVAPGRTLVPLDEGVALQLGQAVTVGTPGYTAYEYRYDLEAGPPRFRREHTLFDPAALEAVRSQAWRSAGAVPDPTRRIYITRPKGSMRPFIGSEQAEAWFQAQGFELVDTSGLSAAEQVRLFATARCIAGQSGAGMANLVFAPPGCQIIVFQANSPHSIFHYFANMGAALGHRVSYCYGESIYEPGGHPGHAGFTLDMADVRALWQAVLAESPALALENER